MCTPRLRQPRRGPDWWRPSASRVSALLRFRSRAFCAPGSLATSSRPRPGRSGIRNAQRSTTQPARTNIFFDFFVFGAPIFGYFGQCEARDGKSKFATSSLQACREGYARGRLPGMTATIVWGRGTFRSSPLATPCARPPHRPVCGHLITNRPQVHFTNLSNALEIMR